MYIPDKSTGDAYSASEFTSFKNEIQNAITMNGETLDAADITQIGKSIQTSAGSGDFYSCVYIGASFLYSLTGPGARKYPNEYKLGMRVRFEVPSTNTTTNPRVRVGTFASTYISEDKVANGGTPSVSIGALVADNYIELVYDETPDGLTKYWRFVKIWGNQIDDESVGLEKLKSGGSPALIGSRMLFNDATGDLSTSIDEISVGNSLTNIGDCRIYGDGVHHYDAETNSLIQRDVPIKLNASAWTWTAEGGYFVATPSANLGKIANSAIETGYYGAYSASIVLYSSVISKQITKNASEVWVSLDSSGVGTLDKIYLQTQMPTPSTGAYCYVRLNRYQQ